MGLGAVTAVSSSSHCNHNEQILFLCFPLFTAPLIGMLQEHNLAYLFETFSIQALPLTTPVIISHVTLYLL